MELADFEIVYDKDYGKIDSTRTVTSSRLHGGGVLPSAISVSLIFVELKTERQNYHNPIGNH